MDSPCGLLALRVWAVIISGHSPRPRYRITNGGLRKYERVIASFVSVLCADCSRLWRIRKYPLCRKTRKPRGWSHRLSVPAFPGEPSLFDRSRAGRLPFSSLTAAIYLPIMVDNGRIMVTSPLLSSRHRRATSSDSFAGYKERFLTPNERRDPIKDWYWLRELPKR
jgi:hypothetical protein